mmetsp:Transcript_68840/g.149835  ORF Transcript_68840/g.149835 Transcript_68840/m.149835 type:complete len:186 (+) Transcript_68840:53-610(+)
MARAAYASLLLASLTALFASCLAEQAVPAVHIDPTDVPFFKFSPGILFRVFYAEPNTGLWCFQLKASPGSSLGQHRNTGTVVGHTLQGKWHYRETDWTASPGHFVHEMPGAVHSIEVPADQEGDTVVQFSVWGSLEFKTARGQDIGSLDFSSAAALQEAACKKQDKLCPDLHRSHQGDDRREESR